MTSSNSHHILADLSSDSKIPSTYSLALTSPNLWFQKHLNHVSNLQETPIHRSEMALSIEWSCTTSGLFHFLILFIPYSSTVYCTPLCHKHFSYFQVVSNGDSKSHSFQKIKFLSQMGLEATNPPSSPPLLLPLPTPIPLLLRASSNDKPARSLYAIPQGANTMFLQIRVSPYPTSHGFRAFATTSGPRR